MRDLMVLIIVGLLGFGIYTYFYGSSGPNLPGPNVVVTKKGESSGSDSDEGGIDIGRVSYKLTNQYGETVTEKSYLHNKSLVFFGFTHCPDICPTALSTLAEVYNQLGSDAEDLKVIFITIDPENDDPETMQEYLLNFNKDFIGLTGPRPEIEKVVKAYKAYANKSDTGQIMHSDLIYLMNENGKYMTHFNRDNTPEQIADYIRKHKGTAE